MKHIKELLLILLVAGGAAMIGSTAGATAVTANSPVVATSPFVRSDCPNPMPEECEVGDETDRCYVGGMAWRGCKDAEN
jgi:hypothetical protein